MQLDSPAFRTPEPSLTSHEAMHSNLGRPGSKTRWINEWVGQVSTIPIVFPFSMARLMHLEHHYHCNDPEKDPDYNDEAPNALMAWYKTWYNRQPGVDGSIHAYKRVLKEMGTPEADRSLKETMWLQLGETIAFRSMTGDGVAPDDASPVGRMTSRTNRISSGSIAYSRLTW